MAVCAVLEIVGGVILASRSISATAMLAIMLAEGSLGSRFVNHLRAGVSLFLRLLVLNQRVLAMTQAFGM